MARFLAPAVCASVAAVCTGAKFASRTFGSASHQAPHIEGAAAVRLSRSNLRDEQSSVALPLGGRPVREGHDALQEVESSTPGGKHPVGLTAGQDIAFKGINLRIEKKLESGSFGTVWKAVVQGGSEGCQRAQRAIALKEVHKGTRHPAQWLRIVTRESYFLGRLRHLPGFAKYYGTLMPQQVGVPSAVIALELAQLDFFEYLSKVFATKSKPNIGAVSKQLLIAMDQMHRMGIAHRDIKAENILVSCQHKMCKLLIADLGCACSTTGDGKFPCNGTDQRLMGTPAEWPPEVWAGGGEAMHKYALRIDTWGLGMVLCQAYLDQHCAYNVKSLREVNKRGIAAMKGDVKTRADIIRTQQTNVEASMRKVEAAAARDGAHWIGGFLRCLLAPHSRNIPTLQACMTLHPEWQVNTVSDDGTAVSELSGPKRKDSDLDLELELDDPETYEPKQERTEEQRQLEAKRAREDTPQASAKRPRQEEQPSVVIDIGEFVPPVPAPQRHRRTPAPESPTRSRRTPAAESPKRPRQEQEPAVVVELAASAPTAPAVAMDPAALNDHSVWDTILALCQAGGAAAAPEPLMN
eukprot:CAMPEP_0176225006 /NCGR_PEP_ID=MMETSP0121_2-20121125/21543_1 /TAXON_ID=160619 /ORGANISM="Kryptoperidinium foliaceum, Strain CCMP 1326" /LENGTH=579 /DNA_ID=CAMNT_0017564269 /DNA_START=42 /DNA_END=1781 /DNA_ORIENTATION=-